MDPKLGKHLARPFSTAGSVITMMKCYFDDVREGVRGDTFLEAITLDEDFPFCCPVSFFSSRFLTDSSREQLIPSDIMHRDLLGYVASRLPQTATESSTGPESNVGRNIPQPLCLLPTLASGITMRNVHR